MCSVDSLLDREETIYRIAQRRSHFKLRFFVPRNSFAITRISAKEIAADKSSNELKKQSIE